MIGRGMTMIIPTLRIRGKKKKTYQIIAKSPVNSKHQGIKMSCENVNNMPEYNSALQMNMELLALKRLITMLRK